MLLQFIQVDTGLLSMEHRVGDKVRIKAATHERKRGVVVEIENNHFIVQVNGEQVQAEEGDLTNLSLAARKAWQSMPDRTVGRPKGSKLSDRVSVTLRIDRELWDLFRQLEANGQIEDRTATINAWLREKTSEFIDESGG